MASPRSALGLESQKGAWVVNLVKGSPAERSGIMKSDVITEIAGESTDTPQELVNAIRGLRVGYRAGITVFRNRAVKKFVVEIASTPK